MLAKFLFSDFNITKYYNCISIFIYAFKNLYIYIYIYIYIYTNSHKCHSQIVRLSKCHSQIVRLPHPRSEDSHGQETFLAPSVDKQTCNYDTRALKPPSLPINPKVKGIEL